MKTTFYSEEPPAVLVQQHGVFVGVTVACNAVCLPDGEQGEQRWQADTNTFWERAEDIDLDAVRAEPEAWLGYVPAAVRERIAEQRRAAYAAEVDPLTAHIQRLRDDVQTEAVAAEIAAIQAERAAAVEAVRARYPYASES